MILFIAGMVVGSAVVIIVGTWLALQLAKGVDEETKRGVKS